jgi:hypothetical protein
MAPNIARELETFQICLLDKDYTSQQFAELNQISIRTNAG